MWQKMLQVGSGGGSITMEQIYSDNTTSEAPTTITLSKPITDFDSIIILYGEYSGSGLTNFYACSAEYTKEMINVIRTTASPRFALYGYSTHQVAYICTNDTTLTRSDVENMKIIGIWGVK